MFHILILSFVLLYPAAAFAQAMAWSLRSPTVSPGPRYGSAMAYDEILEVVLLYGGDRNTGTTPGSYVPPADPLQYNQHDLWKYDGTQWSQITVTGTLPLTSVGATMLFHPGLQRVVLLGGNSAMADRQKMWSFIFDTADSGHWIIEDTNVPMHYGAVGLAYDYSRQVLVLIGAGTNPSVHGLGTWEWDTAVWTQKPDMPQPTTNFNGQVWIPAFAYHQPLGKMVLAHDEPLPSSPAGSVTRTFTYDGTQWTQLPTGALAPPLGTYYTNNQRLMIYDSLRRRLVAVDSTTSYDFDGINWRVAGPSFNYPNGQGQASGMTSRLGTCIAFDKKRNVLVRYGGGNQAAVGQNYNTFSDTWELRRTNSAIQLVNPKVSSIDPLILCTGELLQLHLLVTIGNGTSSATGITYEWFKDGTPISSAPGQPWLYVKDNTTPADTGVYHAEASDVWGNRVISDDAPVFVHDPPTITQEPLGRRLIPGESFALTGNYSSTLPATIWWTKDGNIIPGANTLIYTKTNVTTGDEGTYRLHVQVSCANIQSQPAIVTVGPRIVTEPTFPLNPNVGTPLSLTVTADGAGAVTGSYTAGVDPTLHPIRVAPNDPGSPLPMSFIWRYEGQPITNGGKYTITSTAITSTLQLNQPDYEDEGYYDCVVTDASGPAYAKITQICELLLHPLAPPYLTIEQGRGPEPRTRSGMVYDSQRRRVVLFGGEAFGVSPRSTFTTPTHFTSNDTWEWDGKVWMKRNPVNRPPPTSSFGIAYDSIRGRTVIFGGSKDTPPLFQPGFEVTNNDVWEWDGNDWTKATPPTSPPARLLPSMCFDSTRGEVLMIGGTSFNPEPPDFYASRKTLWAWNGSQWTQRGLMPNGSSAPLPYEGNAFAFDPLRGVAVMFGPFNDNQNPVWEWNGTVWTRILPPATVRVAESRASGSAFFDPVRRRIGLAILGNNLNPGYNTQPNVLWWNGATFIRGENTTIDDINITPPSYQQDLPFGQDKDLGVFDFHRRCYVWHDTPNSVNSGPSQTREMHFSAKVKPIHQPLEVLFVSGQNLVIRSIHAGLRPLTYQWFRDGQPLVNDAHTSGVTTATLTITGAVVADAGSYTLRVTNALNESFTQGITLSVQSTSIVISPAGGDLVITWPGTNGLLESAPAPTGPWFPLHHATSPYRVETNVGRGYFRVRYP